MRFYSFHTLYNLFDITYKLVYFKLFLYLCLIELGYYTVVSMKKKYIELISGPPKWVNEPLNVTLQIGENLALRCEVEGFPKPHITWYKSLSMFLFS